MKVFIVTKVAGCGPQSLLKFSHRYVLGALQILLTTLCFRKWLINVQLRSELLVYYLSTSGEYAEVDKEGNLYKGTAVLMVVRLKQFTPSVVQAIPQPSQARIHI